MISALKSEAMGWAMGGLALVSTYLYWEHVTTQRDAYQAEAERQRERAEILQEHQRWQREQIDTLSAVLSARDDQLQRDAELVDMMRDTARQLERDDATTSDWAGQPLPAAVSDWVRELATETADSRGSSTGSAPAPADPIE